MDLYIVTREQDHESLEILSAHNRLPRALDSAKMTMDEIVGDAGDRAVKPALDIDGRLGPAARVVVAWRIFDNYTVGVHLVTTT